MIRLAFHYLRHLITANHHPVNSGPLVQQYLDQVHAHTHSPEGGRIEALRKKMLGSREVLEIRDYGAGYGGAAKPVIQKEMREVIKSSARGRRDGERLYRLCKAFQPKVGLELGTNLGFSTLYQLAGLSDCRFITIEGASALAKVAQRHFSTMGFHPEVRVGEFSEVLGEMLKGPELNFDYVLLDGNHRYEAVVEYASLLVPRMQPGGILVVDDIRWSKGMERAWDAIQQMEAVTCSIDLFFTGICFVNAGEKEPTYRFRP